MRMALEKAKQAALNGEVPVGAVLVSGEIIIEAENEVIKTCDPTAHAEIVAIRKAAAMEKTSRLPTFDLYVTLEPCPMCAQAISFSRIKRVYFGAFDSKGGGIENGPRIFNYCHHKPEVLGGIMDVQCGDLLRDFFTNKR